MGNLDGTARGVLFDYGNVLATCDCDELAGLVRDAGGAGDAAAARAAHSAAFRAHDAVLAAGGGHEDGWRELMGTLVTAAYGPGADGAVPGIVQSIWERQFRRNLWRDVPAGARALVEDLDARGVPLAIVSNSEGTVAQTLADVGLAGHFTAVFDSADVGVAKPDPRIFAMAAERLGLPAAALVHVGDSESADVAGARAAGARAIRFDGVVENLTRSDADAVASSYDELRAALGRALGLELTAAP